MPSGPGAGKAAIEGARHIYGPRPIAALIPALVRPAFRRRAPATAPILTDWDLIVGPSIAASARPRKLFGGTLSIVCDGTVAMELQYVSDTLISRINTHLGRVAVTRLRFIQDIPLAPPEPPAPRALAVEAARRAVAPLPDGGLRDALEALGRVVLARR